ncbi:MAG: two-component system, NarL family, sensor histidine kinase DegS [Gaiellaceae bacterium]|nr:two-component system, NarL family, sensor histidine kinase DegS [Gaiellaceae bacterium]
MDEPPDAAGRAELTEQILGAEQDERRRIALFLHDGPVQSLSGIALMLDAVGDFLNRGGTDQAREILDKALSRTRTTIGELRDLSFNLEPVVLRDHGFGMAVNALAQEKGIEHKMKIELNVGAAEVLGERTQAALYQIVREALDGAIRRGPPQTFSILIEPEQQTLAVTIRDDAPSERRRRSIEVLEERARTLGAVISVDHDEHGSTMRLVLPMYAASK